ncbi:type II sulfide:quinone oxidoreductase Sqr [Virgibacillus siamensis]|uniref:Type II sulfide:quinone oxidoreductase Sqr n=1 Tax=Virgibacillus siamensis TaxID=480071 RepID=A0ABN1FL95_9BACI
MTQKDNGKIVIVGAGSAGISIASRLLKSAPFLKGQIKLIDPSDDHYYQPLWTLVGAGAAKIEDTHRKQSTLIPEGANWVKEAVEEFCPEENTVITDKGTVVHYEYLIVTAGIEIKWDDIEGLLQTIGKNGVCSNYSSEYVQSTWGNLKHFDGGTAIFTQPSTPVKCAGAPQKIMYLAEDYFNRSGVRNKSKVKFFSGKDTIFGVKRYADTLKEVIKRKEIEDTFQMDLVKIDGTNKVATFQHVESNETMHCKYDMIHVTPPMGAPEFIAKSPLADENGWVAVDPYTLQHHQYKNVFSAGDSASLPTSKTGAAIRQQAPILANNLLAHMDQKEMKMSYDGYTSCPLVTGYNKLVLAEFDYNKNPQETFPIDQSKERTSMYLVKKNLLPILYWNGMLKGTM